MNQLTVMPAPFDDLLGQKLEFVVSKDSLISPFLSSVANCIERLLNLSAYLLREHRSIR